MGEWLYEKHFIKAQMKNQNKFGLHIYNDYTGYGMQEVIENIALALLVFPFLA
jgi:hypothetical protein